MQHRRPSFLQEPFNGQIVAPGLFPFPAPLSERDSDEARTVERLVQRLRELWHDGIIDPPRFDAEESVSGEVMAAFGEASIPPCIRSARTEFEGAMPALKDGARRSNSGNRTHDTTSSRRTQLIPAVEEAKGGRVGPWRDRHMGFAREHQRLELELWVIPGAQSSS